MDGFTRRTERKKQEIRQAVEGLLRNHSPREIKIADIAEKADVSPVTLYNYFENKERLLREVMVQSVEQRVNEIEEMLASGRTWQSKVIAYCSEILDGYPSLPSTRLQQVMVDDPELQEEVKRLYETRVEPKVLELLQGAQKNGELHPDYSGDMLLRLLHTFRRELFYINGEPEVSEWLDFMIRGLEKK